MTTPNPLLLLAERVEGLAGDLRPLNREVALAVGWVRKTPSEARRKNPAWFHPDDCHDGKVMMDSLHGTDVWREPLNYLGSIDAAMSLVPKGMELAIYTNWVLTEGFPKEEDGSWIITDDMPRGCWVRTYGGPESVKNVSGTAPSIARAITALALRARAAIEGDR